MMTMQFFQKKKTVPHKSFFVYFFWSKCAQVIFNIKIIPVIPMEKTFGLLDLDHDVDIRPGMVFVLFYKRSQDPVSIK